MANQSSKKTESINKTDVSKQVKVYLDSDVFKSKIEKIIKLKIETNKELEDKIVEINKNVLIQLYKTLWTKRNFWTSNLTNKNS